MNRLFILLMIALLPLRGWAGDLMSVQMATAGIASISITPHAASAMPADCPMHAQASTADSSPTPAGADACASCDLCLPMTALTTLRFDAVVFSIPSAPPTGGDDFISVSPALLLKPPIF